MKTTQRNFIKISAVLVMIFTVSIFSGCGAGSSGSGSSNGNGGAYSLTIAWPDGSSGERLIPAGSESIYISITGENIEGDPVTTSVSCGQTTVTIGNIPLGEKVATVQALGSSSGVKAQRKETFTINPGETTTSDHIPLGVAIINGTENKVFEPSIINIPLNGTLYFQNWTDSAVTITNLESTINLASASSSTFPSDWITASDFEVASVGESDCYINISDKAAIAGTVECDGVPLAGVTVSIDGSTFTTLADGKYRIFPLAAFGSKTITATKTAYNNYSGSATITAGSVTTHDIDMSLHRINNMLFPGRNLTTGDRPVCVATDDLNDDGNEDIVVTNYNSGTVSVFLNNGSSFAKTDINTGGTPFPVAISDMNSDGKQDIVFADYSNYCVKILPGNGNGTFQSNPTGLTLATGNEPCSIITSDVSGDGKSDIITTNLNGNTISIFINNTNDQNWSFTTTHKIAATYPEYASVADVNGDNITDIVTASYSGGIRVYKGLGSGSFAEGTMGCNCGGSPYSLAVFDVTGDGKQDAVVCHLNNNIITIHPGDGTGAFGAGTSCLLGNNPWSICAADFNGDGKKDIASANCGDGTISILLANGTGFDTKVDYPIGFTPNFVISNDINKDGKIDIIWMSQDSDCIGILFGNGDGTFNIRNDYTAGTYPSGVAISDISEDGNLDMIICNYNSATVSVFKGTGNGKFGAKSDYNTGSYPRCVAAADLNGDSKPDLVTANEGGNNVSVLLNSGSGSFAAAVPYPAGGSPRSVAISDLTGDGKLDLVVANNDGIGYVSVLPGNGNGTFGAATIYDVGSSPYSVAVADLNDDDHSDIVTANFGSNDVSVLLSNGSGGFAGKVDYPIGSASWSVTISDINGDEKPDIIAANINSSSVSVLTGKGDGTFNDKNDLAVGDSPICVKAADVNNDGKIDIIAINNGTANSYIDNVSVLLGNGDGTFGSRVGYPAGNTPDSFAVADINKDGKQDIITANWTSNNASVLLGQ